MKITEYHRSIDIARGRKVNGTYTSVIRDFILIIVLNETITAETRVVLT